MKKLWIFAVLTALTTAAFGGNETVVFANLKTARTLAGIVFDPSGAAIPCVLVSELDLDGTTILRSTITDEQGGWMLEPASRKIYTLLFFSNGFNDVQIRVKLSEKGKELTVSLPVAT